MANKTPLKTETMANQKRPQRPLKETASPSKSDSPTPTAKMGKRYFKKTTYIKGFGIVNAGDELTKEMSEAWAINTPVKIDNYVGKQNDKLSELPKSDKEKLAEYEALNKD